MTDPRPDFLKVADWLGKPEPTVCSQLVMPVLKELGYGEHTLHKVLEQKTYTLKDPNIQKGSKRRVRLDYQPRVYEEGLWVMEVKGTDDQVSFATLGQVRDYAIHPEVRAALMVTVDAAGFRVFDPWDEYWDEPILTVGVNELGDRLDELRAVLGVDHVAHFIRQRHFQHLRRAMSASLEFGVLSDAEREWQELVRDVRANIDAKRREQYRKAAEEYEALHERVLRQSGVWGVAQANNTPWIGTVSEWSDFANAVLYQAEEQRPTQILSAWRAVEAVYKDKVPEGAPWQRALWWLHIVVLGGCLKLRGQPGCEPYATDMARQEIRNVLLEFPDDDVERAFWRWQHVIIPLSVRISAFFPLEELSEQARARLSSEDRIRYRMDPTWFFMHLVRAGLIKQIGEIEPWTAERLDELTAEAEKSPVLTLTPSTEWVGPLGDPWLETWGKMSPLLECGLAALNDNPEGDDLLNDAELRAVVVEAARSEHELLRRPAVPLAERLGLDISGTS
ncbi:MAG: hypothetical protein ACYDA6_04185 [Solirubrobacteraceae bacterium]